MAVLNASIPGVALYAVHDAILHALNDAHMVGLAVALPIVKDQVAGAWLIVHVLPLVALPEPFHIRDHVQFLQQYARVQVAALFGTPPYEDLAPLSV